MKTSFPLFQSHLDVAHAYWDKCVQMGDIVIDATCGNGYDTLKLCKLALTSERGKVYGFDIQEDAIKSTEQLLKTHLPSEIVDRVQLHTQCHSNFLLEIPRRSVQLIVYNLGYLPGGDKRKTTRSDSTIKSLIRAGELLKPGGVISITCYPGHPQGAPERNAVLAYADSLSPRNWSCCHHQWLNRKDSPSLLLIQSCQNPPLSGSIKEDG